MGASISLKNGDFALNFGRASNVETALTSASSEEIEKLVQNAVAKEREKMQTDYETQLTSLKGQLDDELQVRMQAASKEYQAQLAAMDHRIQAAVKPLHIQIHGKLRIGMRRYAAQLELTASSE